MDWGHVGPQTEMRSELVGISSEKTLRPEAGHEVNILVKHVTQIGLEIATAKTRTRCISVIALASQQASLLTTLTPTACSQHSRQRDPLEASVPLPPSSAEEDPGFPPCLQ